MVNAQSQYDPKNRFRPYKRVAGKGGKVKKGPSGLGHKLRGQQRLLAKLLRTKQEIEEKSKNGGDEIDQLEQEQSSLDEKIEAARMRIADIEAERQQKQHNERTKQLAIKSHRVRFLERQRLTKLERLARRRRKKKEDEGNEKELFQIALDQAYVAYFPLDQSRYRGLFMINTESEEGKEDDENDNEKGKEENGNENEKYRHDGDDDAAFFSNRRRLKRRRDLAKRASLRAVAIERALAAFESKNDYKKWIAADQYKRLPKEKWTFEDEENLFGKIVMLTKEEQEKRKAGEEEEDDDRFQIGSQQEAILKAMQEAEANVSSDEDEDDDGKKNKSTDTKKKTSIKPKGGGEKQNLPKHSGQKRTMKRTKSDDDDDSASESENQNGSDSSDNDEYDVMKEALGKKAKYDAASGTSDRLAQADPETSKHVEGNSEAAAAAEELEVKHVESGDESSSDSDASETSSSDSSSSAVGEEKDADDDSGKNANAKNKKERDTTIGVMEKNDPKPLAKEIELQEDDDDDEVDDFLVPADQVENVEDVFVAKSKTGAASRTTKFATNDYWLASSSKPDKSKGWESQQRPRSKPRGGFGGGSGGKKQAHHQKFDNKKRGNSNYKR